MGLSRWVKGCAWGGRSICIGWRPLPGAGSNSPNIPAQSDPTLQQIVEYNNTVLCGPLLRDLAKLVGTGAFDLVSIVGTALTQLCCAWRKRRAAGRMTMIPTSPPCQRRAIGRYCLAGGGCFDSRRSKRRGRRRRAHGAPAMPTLQALGAPACLAAAAHLREHSAPPPQGTVCQGWRMQAHPEQQL